RIGRPLTDFALRPAYPDLAEDLRSVLSAGQDIERRIEPSGETPSQHHLVRIVPYRVQTGAIAGVVVTFVAVPPAG
ncbi:MAG: PAS sensor protein, partial [Methylobacterium sp.]